MASTLIGWNPEDRHFWETEGQQVALRNLRLSVSALVVSGAVWMVWSALVVHLPSAGFHFSTNQLFWLTALPALSGATLGLFYGLAVPLLGSRRFTALATASLLLPAVGIGYAVQDPTTSYAWLVTLALLCGLGGGNSAAAMATVGAFYPAAQRDAVLGLNAGLGRVGVAFTQFLVPLAIAACIGELPDTPGVGTPGAPALIGNAGFVWVPFIAASVAATWLGMNDLPAPRAGFAEQAVIVLRRHTWLMSWLHLGTLGSFLGFAASLPLLLQTQFEQHDMLPFACIAPLIGALLHPFGGRLADRFGGARITILVFVALALGALAAVHALPVAAIDGRQGSSGSPSALVAAFALLSAAAGIGCGSTFRMISTLFEAGPRPESGVEGTAARAFASAIGAYGGFFVPKGFGTAIALTGSAATALQALVCFYLSCIALTWWHYGRRHAIAPC